MKNFDLIVLLWPMLVIFLVTFSVSYHFTKGLLQSLVMAFIKTSLFLIYFWVFFDGTYTFIDDWTYLEGGRQIIKEGIGLTNLHQNWEALLEIGHGEHVVYYLYNAYAIRIFGDGYYAPVALNILLTVPVSYYGARLAASEFAMDEHESKLFFIFLLFHPDILAWSNIMNGKDILVLLLHVLYLYAVYMFFEGRKYTALAIAVPVILVLFFLRFYVPVLFALALVISVFWGMRKGRVRNMAVALVFVSLVMMWIGPDIQYAIGELRNDFINPVFGFMRMLLTPIPFNTEKEYGFLNVPALIYWLLMPFMFLGVAHIWSQKSKYSRYFIAYVFVFVCLYAVYGELQGPRHRVQIDYAIALFQYMGIMQFQKRVADK